MNQPASATRRPSGGTATAGCCPMLVHPHPFFVNSFAAQAPQAQIPPPPPPQLQSQTAVQQCLLGSQQLPPPPPPILQASVTSNSPSSQQQQSAGVLGNVGNNLLTTTGPQQQTQSTRQQQQDHHLNSSPPTNPPPPTNFNTSLAAHTLPLQHLLGRYPASNCMALAAALATASFHSHQQQQLQQAHQPHINHTQQQSTNTDAPANATTQQQQTANQVPLLNFNSYNAAQPFLNVPAPTPSAAHLNLANNQLHQQNQSHSNTTNITYNSSTNGTNTAPLQTSHLAPNQSATQRPLATNTTLNSAANMQQQPNNYRTSTQAPPPPIHQQLPNLQQLGQANRNIFSEEPLSSIFAEHVQNILLSQLFANHQFAPPPVAPIPPPVNAATTRHITPSPIPPQATGVPASSQQQQPVMADSNSSTITAATEQQIQPPATFQPTAQTRSAQVPSLDAYPQTPATGATSAVPVHQQQQQQLSGQLGNQIGQQSSEPVPLQTQQHQSQQPQPQSTIPPSPWSFPQMDQAIAILSNPSIAHSLFSHIVSLFYIPNGMRTEPHHTHHHHHPPHHFHHHLHGSHHHHHHHHGPNGQNNGQDDTMLTMSESKPRGLNRAEIDSLTPYIQMNEKDSRTCVICLSRFELKSKIRPLPCNHAFHAKCVDKWLRANRTCPICRRDALKAYGAKIKRI